MSRNNDADFIHCPDLRHLVMTGAGYNNCVLTGTLVIIKCISLSIVLSNKE